MATLYRGRASEFVQDEEVQQLDVYLGFVPSSMLLEGVDVEKSNCR